MKRELPSTLTASLPRASSRAGDSRFYGWRSKFLTAVLSAGAIILGAQPAAEAALIVAGNDLLLNSGGFINISIFDPFFPGGFTENITLGQTGGPAIIQRDAQVGSTIDTEIVSLQLSGTSAFVGPVTARVGSAQGVIEGGSFGQIINVVQNLLDPGFPTGDPSSFASGTSFFDVFFELDFAGGTLYNDVPHHLGPALITSLPPYPVNYSSPQIHDLWMDIGILGDHSDDVVVGTVGPLAHTPEPTGVLTGLLCLGIAAMRRRRR